MLKKFTGELVRSGDKHQEKYWTRILSIMMIMNIGNLSMMNYDNLKRSLDKYYSCEMEKECSVLCPISLKLFYMLSEII